MHYGKSSRDLSNADTETPTRFIHRWQTYPENDLMNTFIHTGAEYFGPFEVKFLLCTLKRWCCYLTCLTTIAVHIEIGHRVMSSCSNKILRKMWLPKYHHQRQRNKFRWSSQRAESIHERVGKSYDWELLSPEKDCLEIQSSWSPSLRWNLG